MRLSGHIIGSLPFSSELKVDVRERIGCDPSPIDRAGELGRRHFLSCIWPDRVERAIALAAACARVPTLEPEPPEVPNVILRLWPDGAALGLAFASLHGRDVRWVLDR